MIEIYKKINQKIPVQKKQFSMPLSLQIITECGEYGITNWDKLHLFDLLSIIYNRRIRDAQRFLDEQYRARLQKRGIESITPATTKDFDEL